MPSAFPDGVHGEGLLNDPYVAVVVLAAVPRSWPRMRTVAPLERVLPPPTMVTEVIVGAWLFALAAVMKIANNRTACSMTGQPRQGLLLLLLPLLLLLSQLRRPWILPRSGRRCSGHTMLMWCTRVRACCMALSSGGGGGGGSSSERGGVDTSHCVCAQATLESCERRTSALGKRGR